MLLGSDDGIAVWVNGQRAFVFEAMRACVLDENIVPVELVAGWNSILVKVTQYGGAWVFALRMLSTSRTPLTDARYALDNPIKGKRFAKGRETAPLALGVQHPGSHPDGRYQARIEPSSGDGRGQRLDQGDERRSHRCSRRKRDARHRDVRCARPMESRKTSVTLPVESWMAAAKTPLTFTVKSRSVSSRPR